MMQALTDRQRRILARLVSEYIEQGEPVSSAWLAGHSALGLSSATVRNILARLEEQGLVRQPHTSAGRVPTNSGYRLYVNSLLGSRKRVRPSADVEARLRRAGTVEDLLDHASHELSRASHHIGFAIAPPGTTVRLRHIDFVKLDSARVLVVIVTTGGQILHKAVDTDAPYDPVELAEAANFINATFQGVTLEDVRAAIVAQLREERALYDALVARALRLTQSGLTDVTGDDTLHVQGAALLFDELAGATTEAPHEAVETARTLIRIIEEKHRLVALLGECLEGLDDMGLAVIIGTEHSAPDLQPFSVVASTYHDGERAGTVGIIGPTRMRYQRAISAVDALSQVMTRMLDGTQP
jgi:heat-inducible transcriptional repressor